LRQLPGCLDSRPSPWRALGYRVVHDLL
jgi:hypothetical protein